MLPRLPVVLASLAVLKTICADVLTGGEILAQRCHNQDFNNVKSDFIEPNNRTSCALFAEQDLYIPYKLKATEDAETTHLVGTVLDVGDFHGSFISCGEQKKCLKINESPDNNKMKDAIMFYSNAEREDGDAKEEAQPLSYVAAIDCNDGKPGQLYFEFRLNPEKAHLENIQRYYGVIVNADKVATCLDRAKHVFT